MDTLTQKIQSCIGASCKGLVPATSKKMKRKQKVVLPVPLVSVAIKHLLSGALENTVTMTTLDRKHFGRYGLSLRQEILFPPTNEWGFRAVIVSPSKPRRKP